MNMTKIEQMSPDDTSHSHKAEIRRYLFVDDSGSKNWDTPFSPDFVENPPARTPQNLKFWRENYFALAGLYIDSVTMARLNDVIDSKKLEVFGTKHVELHSSDLRNTYQMKKKYLDKYNITADQLRSFIDDFWYSLYAPENMQLIAIVVDKRYFKNPRHNDIIPLELAAEALFDRSDLHPYHECEIVFDQMDSQIKSERRDQGKVLRIAGTKIDLGDGRYAGKYHHVSVKFDNSGNSNFLQLADMVAYNVWRQFVEYGDEWEKHLPDIHRKLPEYAYFTKIVNCFYHSKNNKLSGTGIVKLPDPCNKERSWHLD